MPITTAGVRLLAPRVLLHLGSASYLGYYTYGYKVRPKVEVKPRVRLEVIPRVRVRVRPRVPVSTRVRVRVIKVLGYT